MTRLRHRQTHIHHIKTIGLMLNELSPVHHKCTGTAQACKTCREGTAKEMLWGALSMPVANLRQILFLFSARAPWRIDEALWSYHWVGGESEHGKDHSPGKTEVIYESLPLASATGSNCGTHSPWSVCVLQPIPGLRIKKERKYWENLAKEINIFVCQWAVTLY